MSSGRPEPVAESAHVLALASFLRSEMRCPKRLGVALLGAMSLCGCGIATRFEATTTLRDRLHPARDPSSVVIFTTRPFDFSYEVAGTLWADQALYDVEAGTGLLEALRREGARSGCDAILMTDEPCSETEHAGSRSTAFATAQCLVVRR